MSIQVQLRSPQGDSVVRSIVDGKWSEPLVSPDTVLGEDTWALPGLVDGHAHLASGDMNFEPGVLDDAQRRSREALLAGVMLVLDKGWTDDTTIRVIATVPPAERPDIEAAARILSVESGYYPGFGRTTNPSDLSRAVEEEARAGVGWVKLVGDWPRKGQGPVANFTETQLREAVAVAEAHNSRVAIHTMAREAPSLAVRAGVHSIEHGLFLDEGDLAQLGARGGTWVPTVLRTEAIVQELGAESSGGRLLREGLDNVASLLPNAFEMGVNVLAGTDLVGAPALVSAEALRLRDMGLRPVEVLEAIAYAGFRSTGRDHEFAIGEPANAVLFNENPLTSLDTLRQPETIIRQGRIV